VLQVLAGVQVLLDALVASLDHRQTLLTAVGVGHQLLHTAQHGVVRGDRREGEMRLRLRRTYIYSTPGFLKE